MTIDRDGSIRTAPLAVRCLALSGSFETGLAPPRCFAALAGDFDGQGLSFGALQWNLGRGTLQPLLRRVADRHPAVFVGIFGTDADFLRDLLDAPPAEQLAWAQSIQARNVVGDPWAGRFEALGRMAEFQAIQTEAAQGLFRDAVALARRFGLGSERAIALMFDIRVQNGGIGRAVEARIRADFDGLGSRPSGCDAEAPWLRIVAGRRADVARSRWRDDVRRRKLVIADGAGIVHGRRVDLDADYGIGLKPAFAH